jgi:protease YdgD
MRTSRSIFPTFCVRAATCILMLVTVCGTAEFAASDVSAAETKVIEEVSPPWGAIGQVNVAGYRRMMECTGSLIAPNVVITAAHCVIDPSRGEAFPLEEIHFVAGVRRSKWLGHAKAKCLHFPPQFELLGTKSPANDIVLITLDENLSNIAPLDLDHSEARGAGTVLIHAAYPAHRRYLLTAEFGCHLIAQNPDLWLTDCDARPASSGGPVFTQSEDGLKLAAIMVGLGASGSVAVRIADWIYLNAARNCP